MERHKAFQISAGTRQLQHRATTEAETDRTQLADIQCHLCGLCLEHLNSSLRAFAHQGSIATYPRGSSLGLFGIGRTHRLTVHIGHKHHVLVTGSTRSLLRRVIGDA